MFKELNPLLHSELRLAVMSLLISVEEADFVYIRQQTEFGKVRSDNICTCGKFFHSSQKPGSIHIIGNAIVSHYRIDQKKGVCCLESIQKVHDLFNLADTGNITGIDSGKRSA